MNGVNWSSVFRRRYVLPDEAGDLLFQRLGILGVEYPLVPASIRPVERGILLFQVFDCLFLLGKPPPLALDSVEAASKF